MNGGILEVWLKTEDNDFLINKMLNSSELNAVGGAMGGILKAWLCQ